MASRQVVLSLYKRCLRSARNCPEFDQQQLMMTYTRMRFEDKKTIDARDAQQIQRLLRSGEEELALMENYHYVREMRDRDARDRLEKSWATAVGDGV